MVDPENQRFTKRKKEANKLRYYKLPQFYDYWNERNRAETYTELKGRNT